VRLLESSLTCANGAGERTAHVAKQLSLEQRLWNRTAIERDETLRPPRTVVMNGPRNDLFACAGLTSDQDRAVRSRNGLQQVKELLHRTAASQNPCPTWRIGPAESVPVLELRSEVGVLGGQSTLLHRFLQHVHQLVELKRLGDEIRRAALDGINGVLHCAETSNDDRDDAGIPLPGRLDHPGPVDAGQPEVGDDDVKGELVEEFESTFAAVGFHDFESAFRQAFGHQPAECGLVVDKE
jgi:hypothetical protein